MSLYQPTEESDIIEHSVNQLARKYAGKFDEAEIRPIVTESYNSFADAKVRGFITDAPPSVLFVCVHNAGRSQMAAGWLRHLSKGKIEVYSGGSLPGKDMNSAAVEAMAEVGIDIANEFPKPFAVEIVQAADVVITMGCGDTCPIFPGKRYEDWVLDDPAGLGVEAVRPIRDEIRHRVVDLISDFGIDVK